MAHVNKWYQRSALLSMKDQGWNVVSQCSCPLCHYWGHTTTLTVACVQIYSLLRHRVLSQFPIPAISMKFTVDLLRSSLWWKKCFVYSVILKLLFLATTILVCSCPMKALHHSNTMSQMYENIVSPREGVCLECSCYKVFPAYLHLIPLHYTNINTCRWIHCWTAHSGNASASTQHIHTQCHPIHQR